MTTSAKPVAPPTPPTLEQANARIAEIEKELRKLDALMQERGDWTAYRDSLLRVTKQIVPRSATPMAATSARPFQIESGVPIPPLPPTTVDYAERALKAKGSKMHLNEMLEVVRKNGWKGSGNDKIDRDRLYSAMHRQRHRFRPAGEQTWKLITP
jgi:hypothetical protein